MKWRRKIKIGYPHAFMALLVALAIGSGVAYVCSEARGIYGPIFGGIVTGLLVAIIQFAWDWLDGSSAEKLDNLQVHQILPSRDNRVLYGNKIQSSKERIDVLGVTASRFLDHFASGTSPNEESKVLLSAMKRGVKVRILIQATDPGSSGDISKPTQSPNQRIVELCSEFGEKFQCGSYPAPAAHSLVRIDDRSIIGPVFPGQRSQDMPAIEVSSENQLAKVYSIYFESLWRVRGVIQ